jgi:hypothetical protein
MGHVEEAAAPTEQLDRLLWTARSAGTKMIISRGHDPALIEALFTLGFVREQFGHLMLTPKGQERRRSRAQAMYAAG